MLSVEMIGSCPALLHAGRYHTLACTEALECFLARQSGGIRDANVKRRELLGLPRSALVRVPKDVLEPGCANLLNRSLSVTLSISSLPRSSKSPHSISLPTPAASARSLSPPLGRLHVAGYVGPFAPPLGHRYPPAGNQDSRRILTPSLRCQTAGARYSRLASGGRIAHIQANSLFNRDTSRPSDMGFRRRVHRLELRGPLANCPGGFASSSSLNLADS